MTRQRRHYPPEQKVALLRAHFLDKVPVSDLCEKHGIAVNLFYLWQKQFFENGTAAFTINDKRRQADPQEKARDRDAGLVMPALDKIDDLVAGVVGNPESF